MKSMEITWHECEEKYVDQKKDAGTGIEKLTYTMEIYHMNEYSRNL